MISASIQLIKFGGIMNSILMILGSLVFTTTALAMPAVGDYALYSITHMNQTGTYESTIKAKDGATFTVENKINIGGQTQVQSEQKKEADLFSDSSVANLLAQCAQSGGNLETVTVHAGSFNSCKVPFQNNDSSGYLWLGQVAFAILKVESLNSNNEVTYLELQSFKMGR